jgi:DNA-binding FadR family transcriptional regulator
MAPVEALGLSKNPAAAISGASESHDSVDGVPSDRVAVAPERTGSRTDEVVRALTDLIVARGLKPGDLLPAEPELSRELDIGRNSLREAIRALRGIGVVEVRHGYGTFVGELSMSALTDELLFHSRVASTDGKEYLRHLIEVRESLEQGLLSSLISDRLAPDADRLTTILERMDAEAERGASDPRTDQEFHEVLYEPLRNPVATSLIRVFWSVFRELVTWGDEDAVAAMLTADSHHTILLAVKAGDARGARVAMRNHFLGLRDRLGMSEHDAD